MILRFMRRSDLELMVEIDREANDVPWAQEEFIDAIKCPDMVTLVGEIEGIPVCFVMYDSLPTEIHLVRLAVHPDWWGRGYGRKIVETVYSRLSPRRKTRVFLEVSDRNTDAHLFLRACGFKATSVLRGEDGDAYRFERRYMPAMVTA